MGDEDEAGQFGGVGERGKEVYLWKAKHLLGKMKVDALDLSEPSLEWAARIRNQEHVDRLKTSFQQHGSVNQDIHAVVIDGEKWAQFQSFKDTGTEPSGSLVDVNALKEGKGMQVFAGDHSRQATAELRKRYPNTIIWNTLPTDVYIAPPSPETFRMLRIIGNMDNKIAGFNLNTDFATVVKQMRRHYQAILRQFKRKGEEPAKKHVVTMKEDYAFSLGVPLASVGQMFQLANFSEECWDPCEKILTGNCKPFMPLGAKKPKQYKIPHSAHPFTLLGGIPDRVVAKLLNKVVSGEFDFKMLRTECTKVKGIRRIKAEAMQQLKTAHDGDMETDPDTGAITWASVSKAFPSIGCPDFINRWLPVVKECPARQPLPVNFFDEIEREVINHKKIKVFVYVFTV